MPAHLCAVLGAAAALLVAATTGTDAATCNGQIGSGTTITGKTIYDPYSPVEVSDGYEIGITNIGDETCSYALVFENRAAQPKLGGVLTYHIADRQRAMSLQSGPVGKLVMRLQKPVPASGTARIEYGVVIPRGQYAPPGGDYRDSLDLALHAVDDQGAVSDLPLQTATLSIGYTVARVLSVNIKGGGSATTLNLDTLEKGKQRSVEIQARSNQSYRFAVSSENGGVLALTPPVPGQSWSVPYSAMLGNQPLDLSTVSSVYDQPPTRPEGDAGHRLTVTVGDTDRRRAGRYEDVLTIEIRPAVP